MRRVLLLGLTLSFSLAAALLAPGAIEAASQPSAVPPMGGSFAVSQRDSEHLGQAMAFNWERNEYLVVWQDGAAGAAILGQRVTGQGRLVGPVPVSISTNQADQLPRHSPSVAYDPVHHRYLVVWAVDVSGDNSNWDLAGRFIPWEGPQQAQPEFWITDWTGSERQPQVVYAGAQGEFLVALVHERGGGVQPYIAGVRVRAGGGFAGSVNIASGGEARGRPQLAYHPGRNQYLVAHEVRRGVSWDVEAVRLGGDGSVLGGGAFEIASNTADEAHAAVAACDNADQYLVVWRSQNEQGQADIHGRIVDGNGNPAPGIVIHAAGGVGDWPALACHSALQQYLVVWQQQDSETGAKSGILGARVNLQGDHDAVPLEIAPPSSVPADAGRPATARGFGPSYLVTWQQGRAGTAYQDLYGRLVGLAPCHLFLPEVWRGPR